MGKGASVAAFILLVGSIVALAARHALIASGAAGLLVQALSVALMLWARVTFGRRSFHLAANPTEGGIVTTGPYRHVRHPIYAAILWFVWAGVSTNLSAVDAALAVAATAGTAVRFLSEEKLLLEQYPEYRAYATATKRLVPFVF